MSRQNVSLRRPLSYFSPVVFQTPRYSDREKSNSTESVIVRGWVERNWLSNRTYGRRPWKTWKERIIRITSWFIDCIFLSFNFSPFRGWYAFSFLSRSRNSSSIHPIHGFLFLPFLLRHVPPDMQVRATVCVTTSVSTEIPLECQTFLRKKGVKRTNERDGRIFFVRAHCDIRLPNPVWQKCACPSLVTTSVIP